MIADSLHTRPAHLSYFQGRTTSLVDENVEIPIVRGRINTLRVLNPDPQHRTLHGTEYAG